MWVAPPQAGVFQQRLKGRGGGLRLHWGSSRGGKGIVCQGLSEGLRGCRGASRGEHESRCFSKGYTRFSLAYGFARGIPARSRNTTLHSGEETYSLWKSKRQWGWNVPTTSQKCRQSRCGVPSALLRQTGRRGSIPLRTKSWPAARALSPNQKGGWVGAMWEWGVAWGPRVRGSWSTVELLVAFPIKEKRSGGRDFAWSDTCSVVSPVLTVSHASLPRGQPVSIL